MNAREPHQSFEAARRQHLIDATIEALADVGFKATSLSQIAKRADVSTGLFAHYFGDKDGLLEATLRFMAARLVRATRERLRAARTPRERLDAVPDSALADQEFERRTSAVWLAFWGQITHSARYQRIQFIYQRRMLSNLRHDLRALVPTHCVEPYATMIASMIDGVWIRSHATPTEADGSSARAIVRALIDRLVNAPPSQATPFEPRSSAAPMTVCGMTHVIGPIGSDILDSFTPARQQDLDAAVDRARLGLAAWRQMSGPARERVLRHCADLLRGEQDEIARLDALCGGRAIAQTLATILPRAALMFESLAALASRPACKGVELEPGLFCYTRHDPLGIIGGFGHWSSPLFDVCRQAAPALALGNALVFRPSSQAPLTALRIGEIIERAGVPAGVVTILQGDDDTIQLMRAHPDLAIVEPHHGMAKTATIVLAGADMDRVAIAILRGHRPWSRTPDLSETRVYVQSDGLAALRSRLQAHAKKIRVGDPLDPAMQIGSLVSQGHRDHVRSLIAQAIDDGARRIVGGSRQTNRTASALLALTILDGCREEMPIVQQNLFAPILALLAFDDEATIFRSIMSQGRRTAVEIFAADTSLAYRFGEKLGTDLCWVHNAMARWTHDDTEFDSRHAAAEACATYSRSTRIIRRDDRRL